MDEFTDYRHRSAGKDPPVTAVASQLGHRVLCTLPAFNLSPAPIPRAVLGHMSEEADDRSVCNSSIAPARLSGSA